MERVQERVKLASSYIEATGENIFLTGRAGTGKTTFLKSLPNYTSKRMVVVAPTAVAALNAGGVTIHSFFQLKPQLYQPEATQLEFKASRQKRSLIASLDLLVIDEVSMVRCDLMDAIDATLRYYRGSTKPFGGVQLLMIGDLLQLSPVVRDDEWSFLAPYYSSPYFFESRALRASSYVSIELTHIYRQSDSEFIDILNACRDMRYDKKLFDKLNSRYIPDFNPEDGYITLTTHNYKAKAINSRKMEQIDKPEFIYSASIKGNFPESIYPCDSDLVLKQGAQVMFIKNDSSLMKQYYNGKIGHIVDISESSIEVDAGDEDTIFVEREQWQNSRYKVNPSTKEIEMEVIGEFTQYPLQAAWAITIHKSQGLTFDRAVVDAGDAFAHGQAYVALSRCRSLEGIVLSGKIGMESLKSDVLVRDFTNNVDREHPTDESLEDSKKRYHLALLTELFDMSALCAKSALMASLLESAAGKIYPTLCQQWHKNMEPIRADINDISRRFLSRIARAEDIESQRVAKGAEYFTSKIEEHILPLIGGWDVELDNKENQKSIDDQYSSLVGHLYSKMELLKVASSGFTTVKYLDRRAAITFEKPRFKSVDLKRKSTDVQNPLLFEQLRLWRVAVARDKGMPPYVIMAQSALIGVCEALPTTNKELKRVKGIGDKFIAKYAPEVLSIVERYMDSAGIETSLQLDDKPEEPKVKKEKKPKKPKEPKVIKPSTKSVTMELFKEKLSPVEIAQQRGLTVSTIYSHLCHYVRTREISASDLLPEELIKIIVDTKRRNPDKTTKELKDIIGSSVEYHQILVALASMEL